MATIKKTARKMQMGGGINPMMKMGGKAKNGKSFPDLNKDGKITKADILKGRGVIAKKGMKVKKAQNGNKTPLPPKFPATPKGPTKGKLIDSPIKKQKASSTGPYLAKTGTKMTKKCKYGCY